MKQNRAFSLLETMITVSVLGILAAVATLSISHVVSSSKEQKLRSDVGTINRSISAFVASGGNLSGASSPADVLHALKQRSASSSRSPGMGGSKLDASVNFVMQSRSEADSGNLRVYWDAETLRFQIASRGDQPGIKAFFIDADLAEQDFGTTETRSALLYAAEDSWIWDYADAPVPSSSGPSTVPLSDVPDDTAPSTPPPSSPGPTGAFPLESPLFSLSAGEYPVTDFQLSLALSNPNTAGSSDIYYSIDFGEWERYAGPFLISPNARIAAQSIALSDNYLSSAPVSGTYAALPVQLSPPLISPDRTELGLFSGREAIVTLVNPNDPEVSALEYRIAGDPWLPYTDPFLVSRDDYLNGALIQARAVPTAPHYETSSTALQNIGLEPMAITGLANGDFSDPQGSDTMVTNLDSGNSSSYFEWGRDYLNSNETTSSELSKSWLNYDSVSFQDISTGHLFQIGSLTYYNGTIIAGTGADQVTFTTDLALDINGFFSTVSFRFDFELINTPNKNDPDDPWPDADYVRLANPIASETIAINGVEFQLKLEFGSSTSDGISYFDEFHVLEGKDATTSLYGTLVEIGSIDFNK